MNSSDFRRDALSACGAFALLSACSGSVGSPVIAPTGSPQQSQSFKYTGATQTFTVPVGVTNLTIAATGASGAGAAQRGTGRPGGLGAVVEATIHVKPGQVLTIVVGGKAKGAHGGFNGGATGAYGGGGASDVRTGKGRLGDRIIVAGGGGGAGASYEWAGSSSSFYWCYGGTGGAGGANNGGRGRGGGCGGGGGGVGGSQGSEAMAATPARMAVLRWAAALAAAALRARRASSSLAAPVPTCASAAAAAVAVAITAAAAVAAAVVA
jgi:hypothetical protein